MRNSARNLVRRVLVMAALSAVCPTAWASYYWTFFPAPFPSASTFSPVRGRFDIDALKDNTVQYFIAERGPTALVATDSEAAIYNRIHQAAAVWNSVNTSNLRLRYGGILPSGSTLSGPAIEIVFDDDMPAGILAQTKPVFPEKPFETAAGKDIAFVPLLRARMQLRANLAAPGFEQASYSDEFFQTLVHEFGHALGLQHTLTSGAMSTAITRATSKGFPLSPDDIAAISALYPVPRQAKTKGAISGRVTSSSDKTLNLASVVALGANGSAISTLTNPDGSYRLEGLPAGAYYVYVHPLPPAVGGELTPANVVPPVDIAGKNYPADTGFATRFYPATTDWKKASQITVTAGGLTEKIDFVLPVRSGPAIHSMETYGYQESVAVAAPPLVTKSRQPVVFHAFGTAVNSEKEMAPGLEISAIGSGAQIETGSLRYYTQGFLQMTVTAGELAQRTSVALAATLNDDLYVLPAAFTVVPVGPPLISDLTPWFTSNGVPMLSIRGSNLGASTRIMLDGVAATLAAANEDGSLLVVVPPGPSAYLASPEAVNQDGQSSLQALGTKTRALYRYLTQAEASIVAAPRPLVAGRDVWITISGTGTHFAQGQTQIGFGSNDIAVRRVWIYNTGFLIANVSISASAKPGPVQVNVTTGLESINTKDGIEISPPVEGQITVLLPVVNQATGLAGVPAGGNALIHVSRLPANTSGWALTIGGKFVPFEVLDANTIMAKVPADLPAGPQGVQLGAPSAQAAPGGITAVFMQVDAAPPQITQTAVLSRAAGADTSLSETTPAKAGDHIVLVTVGLNQDAEAAAPVEEVRLNIAGLDYAVDSIAPGPDEYKFVNFVWLTVPGDLPFEAGKTQASFPVTVTRGTRQSQALVLYVTRPAQ